MAKSGIYLFLNLEEAKVLRRHLVYCNDDALILKDILHQLGEPLDKGNWEE